MSNVLLLRHGKSDWDADVNDFHRPLNKRGKRACQRIGHWMQQHGYSIDQVWSSPAFRAIESAEKTVKTLSLPVSIIEQVPSLYEASTATLLELISKARQLSATTLIVGHNSSMEMALSTLVPEQLAGYDSEKIMATATLAHLYFDDDGYIELKRLLQPKTLPKQFEVITQQGKIKANRPPYYFQQSGVVPYRRFEGKWQVMLVAKKSKSKWGLPKGIVEPGLSSLQSAAKEAMEEAGVLGNIEDKVLGMYQHHKWGGVCDISIYPLQVEQCLDDAAWESQQRTRRWFFIDEVGEFIDNDDIIEIVDSLVSHLGAA
jgi:phosphohistidine phosphatase